MFVVVIIVGIVIIVIIFVIINFVECLDILVIVLNGSWLKWIISLFLIDGVSRRIIDFGSCIVR